ncbi:hypothetical protein DPMN_020826 [Dreissena polymorpha]|uniref:Uncharacterized protein n=1 Tax=Dreissena polymorpha TaxID=45954 RepID=A0A9D4NL68_DREPO|nr:hypothetical protein DPMN_020826 [Dreissena polymorpha]
MLDIDVNRCYKVVHFCKILHIHVLNKILFQNSRCLQIILTHFEIKTVGGYRNPDK